MNYNKVYSVEKMLADHARPVHYELPLPPRQEAVPRAAKAAQLYIHSQRGRAGRSIDDATESSSMRPAWELPARAKPLASHSLNVIPGRRKAARPDIQYLCR